MMKNIIQSNGKKMLLSVAALAMLACGCTGVTSNVTNINVQLAENAEKVYLHDMVNTVSLTALREDSCCIVGDVKKVEETDSFYFVMNQQKNMLVKFDKKGAPKSSYCKMGHAKGEYITINDFSVDEQQGIISLLADYTKVFLLDFSFNVKEVYELTTPLERICAFESSIYGYNMLNNKIVAVSADGCKDIVQGVQLPSWVYSQTPVFFKTGGKLLVSLECDNCIYSLSNNKTDKFVSYSYKGYDEILKRYSNEGGAEDDMFLSTPIMMRGISLDDDVLRLIYSKDMIVRYASIDLQKNDVVADGVFIGSPSPEWNGQQNEWIADSFVDGTELPVDSGYMEKIKYVNGKNLLGPVVVKYFFK